jgi:hypothetical protein
VDEEIPDWLKDLEGPNLPPEQAAYTSDEKPEFLPAPQLSRRSGNFRRIPASGKRNTL